MLRFETSVGGITCNKCTARIERGLLGEKPLVENLRVDVVTKFFKR